MTLKTIVIESLSDNARHRTDLEVGDTLTLRELGQGRGWLSGESVDTGGKRGTNNTFHFSVGIHEASLEYREA